jgi:hypothetical protein
MTVYPSTPAVRVVVKKVFKALAVLGIYTHPKGKWIGDCLSCGSSEISGIFGTHQRYWGYAFWHQQDDDNFKHSGELMIAFGARLDDEETGLLIGNIIKRAFKAEGLLVDWDGTISQRIMVKERIVQALESTLKVEDNKREKALVS